MNDNVIDPFRQASNYLWLPFRNDSSEEVPAFGVMRVTGVIEEYGQAIIKIDKPSSAFKRIYAVNGVTPVPAGERGGCLYGLDAPIPVAYEGGTPAVDEGWGVKPGSWKLNKNYPTGFTVQGAPDPASTRIFAIQQPINSLIGVLNASLNQGSTAAFSVWKGTGGSESDETNWDITGQDWLMKSGATALSSGTRIVAEWINGIWYFTEARCA